MRLLAVLAFFGGLSILMTWPWGAHMGDSMIGQHGDGEYFIWLTGWYPEAILRLGVSPLWVPWLSYPEGFALANTEMTPGTALLALPITLTFGATAGYNFVMLSSVMLAGAAAYLWAYRVTRSHPSALLAGIAFTYMPDHMVRLGGHITLVCTQWLAFYLMLLHSMLRERNGSRSVPTAAGITLGLLALSSQYLFYYALVLSPLLVAGYAQWVGPGAWKRRTLWRQLAILGLVGAPLVLAAEAPYLQLVFSGAGPGPHTISEAQIHGASLTDYLVPVPYQVSSYALIDGFFDPIAGASLAEHTIYVGIVALGLAFVAVRARSHPARARRELRLWSVLALIALILSMGVSLSIAHGTVVVELPDWLRAWYPYAETFVPLPGYILFRILPFYSAMRVWTRWAFAVNLFLSLLAGAGAAALLHRARAGLRLPLAVGLCFFVLADFSMIPVTLTPVRGRVADYWLAEQPGQGAVVQLPIYQSLTYAHMVYYAEVSGKPYVGSNFGSFWSPQARRLISTVDGFPDEPSIALLRELGVQWVVIDAKTFSDFDSTRANMEFWGLRPRFSADGTWVYELLPP